MVCACVSVCGGGGNAPVEEVLVLVPEDRPALVLRDQPVHPVEVPVRVVPEKNHRQSEVIRAIVLEGGL